MACRAAMRTSAFASERSRRSSSGKSVALSPLPQCTDNRPPNLIVLVRREGAQFRYSTLLTQGLGSLGSDEEVTLTVLKNLKDWPMVVRLRERPQSTEDRGRMPGPQLGSPGLGVLLVSQIVKDARLGVESHVGRRRLERIRSWVFVSSKSPVWRVAPSAPPTSTENGMV